MLGPGSLPVYELGWAGHAVPPNLIEGVLGLLHGLTATSSSFSQACLGLGSLSPLKPSLRTPDTMLVAMGQTTGPQTSWADDL